MFSSRVFLYLLSLTMSLSDTDFIISESFDDASSLVLRKKARVYTQDRDSFYFWQQTGPRIQKALHLLSE